MPVQYCMNCGAGSHYSVSKPSKCIKCDKSFGVAATIKVAAIPCDYQPVIQPEDKPITGAEALAKFNIAPLTEDDVVILSQSKISFKEIMKDPESVDSARPKGKKVGSRSRKKTEQGE